MGAAAESAREFLTDHDRIRHLGALRDRLETMICEKLPNAVINGRKATRVWNTVNLGFPGLEAEAILLGLSERGVCAD